MNRPLNGLLLGTAAGAIDVVPMLVQKLPLSADLSAFALWVVAGFFLSTSTLAIPVPFKGLLVSFLCLLPTAIIIGAEAPVSLVPIAIMTAVLGTILGWAVNALCR